MMDKYKKIIGFIILVIIPLISVKVMGSVKLPMTNHIDMKLPLEIKYNGNLIKYAFSYSVNKYAVDRMTRLDITPYLLIQNQNLIDTIYLPRRIYEGDLYTKVAIRNHQLDENLHLTNLQSFSDSELSDSILIDNNTSKIIGLSFKIVKLNCCDRFEIDEFISNYRVACYSSDYVDMLPPVIDVVRNKNDNLKSRVDSGSVYVNFRINEKDIDFSWGDNKKQMQKMRDALLKVVNDDFAQFDSALIKGQASPDGSLDFNVKLAMQRTEGAVAYLTNELKALNITPINTKLFHIGYIPEAWDELRVKVSESDLIPNKAEVLNILSSNMGIEEKKSLLKRYRPAYTFLRDSILGSLRRVDYKFYFTFKDLTEEEQVDLIDVRPDVYSPSDFIELSMMLDSIGNVEVLEKAIASYPNHIMILQNLLAAYIQQQRWSDARILLSKIDLKQCCLGGKGFLRNLFIYCVETSDVSLIKELNSELINDPKLISDSTLVDELRKQLGIIALLEKNYTEAVRYLKNFEEWNTVLAYIGIENYSMAWDLTQTLTPITAKEFYLKACAAAFASDYDAAMANLRKAVGIDSRWANIASNELAFKFMNIQINTLYYE